ncbi:RGS domain-containing serine/threonine-protein kinase A [Rhizoctonia solani]|uniref:RGS domain-containing serine/threonine-protein kinase A n=1 Tax=Rhizoctonia solani TaxID=456999 RepID=A0A0K6FZQ7_9AGAM|nr:RGS domain-containing serine/threonine-protein kinase A [Rhizoctonia solani]
MQPPLIHDEMTYDEMTYHEMTYAHVSMMLNRSASDIIDFRDALEAFKLFLNVQEEVTVCKEQLKVLRSQATYVLEECASYRGEEGAQDVTTTLSTVTQTLFQVSKTFQAKARWELIIQEYLIVSELELAIGNAFRILKDQLRQLTGAEHATSLFHSKKLGQARGKDRKKLESLELEVQSDEDPDTMVSRLMEERLKVLGDSMAILAQQQIDARKSLAFIAELTGKSLPPNIMLDKKFVTIGNHAINQGYSYDVFVGEYFTGEKIAIKVLRHRVDEETATKTHMRFARLTENWAALRHDCILPFYGVGVMQSPVSSTEYQLYLVSPYLKNQDIKRHIKSYPTVSGRARLQMALDIARGLKHMHEGEDLPQLEGKGVVHSALNIYNVLVKDSGRAVISGFGHAKVIKDFQASFTGDNSEYRYMGPEILDGAVLTFGSDIWSWAMTSLEILTDEPPFGAKTRGTKIIQMIGTNRRPERANHPKIEEYEHSDEIWQLFEDCWKKQPEDRPSAREIVTRLRELEKLLATTEIIGLLSEHGYLDLDITARIDLERCDKIAATSGGAGDIFRGYLHDGSKVAIKCPRPRRPTVPSDGRRSFIKEIAKEGYSWSKHRHSNILEILGIALFHNRIALVSPWMENGTVVDYIKQQPNADRPNLCAQVSSGLAYLHQAGTIHGDLKGINVLVSKSGVAKIIDFGSTVLNHYSVQFTGGDMSHTFTWRWAAPELLAADSENAKASKQADVYALGMTIFEIIVGEVPFEDIIDSQVVLAVLRGERPRRSVERISQLSRDGDRLWNLLKTCWHSDPSIRPAAEDIRLEMSQITPSGLRIYP